MAFTESTSTHSLLWGVLFGTVAVLGEASSVPWLLLVGIAVPAAFARMLCESYAVRSLFVVHEARGDYRTHAGD